MPSRNGSDRLETLGLMLTTMRPHGSSALRAFIDRYLAPLPGAEVDAFGNVHVTIPHPNGTPSRVLWSCHTDTVHARGGVQAIDIRGDWIGIVDPSVAGPGCLGADDTAGVWICRELILDRVPGHYIFHDGEEVGCLGSGLLAEETPERLAGIDIAIAFDRGGRSDVITSQRGARCCSDRFARALGRQLARRGAGPRYPAAGVYTDTAEYTHLVAECTNLSVGYEAQHSPRERLHWPTTYTLWDACRRLDQRRLPVDRVPEPRPVVTYQWASWRDSTWDRDRASTRLGTGVEWDLCEVCGTPYELDDPGNGAVRYWRFCSEACELESSIAPRRA